jgi:hypothetical protein
MRWSLRAAQQRSAPLGQHRPTQAAPAHCAATLQCAQRKPLQPSHGAGLTVAAASRSEHRVPDDKAARRQQRTANEADRPPRQLFRQRPAGSGGAGGSERALPWARGTCMPVDILLYACFKKSRTCSVGCASLLGVCARGLRGAPCWLCRAHYCRRPDAAYRGTASGGTA